MIELKNVAQYVTEKIEVSSITKSVYITTDNMVASKGGLTECESLPKANKVTRYAPGDILVSNIRPYFKKIWYANKIGGCSNDVIVFRKSNEYFDSKFLYYVLSQDSFFDFMMAGSNGTKMPRGNKNTIPNFLIPNYDLKKQKIIAEILSTYDDLIENNKKQIKLLEEAAQRLYKEWFVDLRFPGYEDTPIVNGLPKGWNKQQLQEMNCRLESGSRPKGGIDKSISSGIPSIGAENVIGLGKYNYGSEKFITADFFNKMKKGKITDKDILIYKDGAYIGRTSLFQDGFPHSLAAVNEHVFLLHMQDEMLQYYIFYTLYQKEYFNKMQKLNKNAAQPGINSSALLKLELVVPSYDIICKFNAFVTPIMKQIFDKAKQNHMLTQARDKLLPKLISGELEV